MTITARYFLDATEQGDLLPLTKTEVRDWLRIAETNRRAARAVEAQPANIQSFTVCFAMEYLKGRGPYDRKARRVRLLARLRRRS